MAAVVREGPFGRFCIPADRADGRGGPNFSTAICFYLSLRYEGK